MRTWRQMGRAIITSELYYDVHDRVKFIPVIVSPTDVRLIPPPLSLTTWYVIGTPGNRELAPLLRHLRGEPALIPEPLETAPGTGINSRSAEAVDSSTAITKPSNALVLIARPRRTT